MERSIQRMNPQRGKRFAEMHGLCGQSLRLCHPLIRRKLGGMRTPSRPPRHPGVYAIVCLATGEHYVGSSVDIARRWLCHRHRLRTGGHGNRRLRERWLTHGDASIAFVVLQRMPAGTDQGAIIDAELAWMKRTRPALNIIADLAWPAPPAVISAGLREWHRNLGEGRRQERSRRMVLAWRRRKREGRFQRERSPATRRRISEGLRRRWMGLTDEERAAHVARLAEAWKDPRVRARQRRGCAAWWRDLPPKERAAMVGRQARARARVRRTR